MEHETPDARRLIDSERRVHRILRTRFADALAEMGVSFAQLEVMELLHEVEKTHPGAIGRHLFITRQSAGHLVRQLERGSLVETWPVSGGSIAVRLLDTGRKRIRHCYRALEPTFACLDALEPGHEHGSNGISVPVRTFSDHARSLGGSSRPSPG